MPSCEFNHLSHFCFSHLVGEDAAYAHTVAVDMKHDLYCLFAAFVEESLENMNDEFHRRIVVIK